MVWRAGFDIGLRGKFRIQDCLFVSGPEKSGSVFQASQHYFAIDR
jgi:hypothetical protein